MFAAAYKDRRDMKDTPCIPLCKPTAKDIQTARRIQDKARQALGSAMRVAAEEAIAELSPIADSEPPPVHDWNSTSLVAWNLPGGGPRFTPYQAQRLVRGWRCKLCGKYGMKPGDKQVVRHPARWPD